MMAIGKTQVNIELNTPVRNTEVIVKSPFLVIFSLQILGFIYFQLIVNKTSIA